MRTCAEANCTVKAKQGFRLHKWPKDETLSAVWTKKVRRLGEDGKKAYFMSAINLENVMKPGNAGNN